MQDEVLRLEARVHKLRASGGKMDQLTDAQRSLADAQHKVEKSTEAYDFICQQMHSELARFQDDRCKAMVRACAHASPRLVHTVSSMPLLLETTTEHGADSVGSAN